jgi:glycosyltransferase involved in cell wall biosynthesis
MPLKVLHLISGLGYGGAETALTRLVPALRSRGVESQVLCLGPTGPHQATLEHAGTSVECLGARGPFSLFTLPRHVATRVDALRPDLLQTWMYHADLVGARLPSPHPPLVWNVRSGRPDLPGARWRTRATIFACKRYAPHAPQAIVFCSADSRLRHGAAGYPLERSLVIPNGFDLITTADAPRAPGPLVGIVARFDPTKDYGTFIRAAALIARRRPDVRFLAAGAGVDRQNSTLDAWIRREGLGDRISLLGHRDDVPRLLPTLDLFLLSSLTEGFPNVVGEAMAAGVPCVVTDAGDSRLLVGDTGAVAPPGDAPALAEAALRLLDEPEELRLQRRSRARERIRSEFSLATAADKYASLYRDVVSGRPVSIS